MNAHAAQLEVALDQVRGFIYPNETELQWGLLIVIYPYITGLVAGAFILASLEKGHETCNVRTAAVSHNNRGVRYTHR